MVKHRAVHNNWQIASTCICSSCWFSLIIRINIQCERPRFITNVSLISKQAALACYLFYIFANLPRCEIFTRPSWITNSMGQTRLQPNWSRATSSPKSSNVIYRANAWSGFPFTSVLFVSFIHRSNQHVSHRACGHSVTIIFFKKVQAGILKHR